MLTVDVKFVANELTPGLENGEYKVKAGSSVREIIAVCEDQYGVVVPPDNFKMMYSLFNGKPITLDGKVTVDGTLHICRVVMGG